VKELKSMQEKCLACVAADYCFPGDLDAIEESVREIESEFPKEKIEENDQRIMDFTRRMFLHSHLFRFMILYSLRISFFMLSDSRVSDKAVKVMKDLFKLVARDFTLLYPRDQKEGTPHGN